MKFENMRSKNFAVLNGGLINGGKMQKAVFTVSVRGIVAISGVHYCESQSGERFVTLPSVKGKDGYKPVSWFLQDGYKGELTDIVIEAYNKMAYTEVKVVDPNGGNDEW